MILVDVSTEITFYGTMTYDAPGVLQLQDEQGRPQRYLLGRRERLKEK